MVLHLVSLNKGKSGSMESLKQYLNHLIDITLTKEELEDIDRKEILEHLEYLIEYELEDQEEYWQQKIDDFVKEIY